MSRLRVTGSQKGGQAQGQWQSQMEKSVESQSKVKDQGQI